MGHSKRLHKMTRRRDDRMHTIVIEFFLFLFVTAYCVFRSCALWFLPTWYKSITNEVILITGGGRGIGRLLAVEFAKYKPKQIIIWGRNEDTLKATCRAVMANDVSCMYMECDVSNREEVYEKAADIEKNVGNVTMLVNNAGVVFGETIEDSDPENIEKTINTNVMAHFWIIKSFLPSMKENNHGHIVTVNSMLGLMGLAGALDYCSSKHAAMGLAESLQYELLNEGKQGIHFTNIHPYLIDTAMFAGCTTRFPSLFPAIEKEHVAWKIVDAVLRNKHQVLMPRIMYVLYIVKSLLPVDALWVTQKFTGVDRAMNSFHGRKCNKS